MNNKKTVIIEYAEKLIKENLVGENDSIALRDGENYLIAKGSLKGLTEENIEVKKLSEGSDDAAAVLNAYENVNAVIYSHPEYCKIAAKSGKDMYAPLDDMAQIVGYKCRITPDKTDKIVGAFKGANSIFVENGGAMTSGRTLDEAFTCLMVLEKAAKITICGSVIGGARKIGFIDAKLMRLVYKMKYSKQNQKNKAEGEA